MKLPLQITFRGMEPSEAVEANIREKATKLERYCDHIMACRVVVEEPHAHKHQGRLFHVRLDITVPKGEIVASRNPDQHRAHEDVYVAIRDAFNAATRQLEDYVRRERHKVKRHEAAAHGRIVELVPYEDYGRIETPDGRSIYFHRNSLLEADFDQLEIDDEVRFQEEAGANGPQASSVHPIGKHHLE